MKIAMLYKKAIIILLFELGWGVKFNIVGVISLSELFLLVFVPLFILPKMKWGKAKDLMKITIAYVVLLCFQVFSEYMVGNDLQSALKGLAITVVSYFHFMFLVYYLSKSKWLILVLVVSRVVNMLVFGSIIEKESVEDLVQGEAAAYLKFYVAPLVILVFLAVSIIYRYKYFSLLFSLLGVVLVLLGARSAGTLSLLSGLVAYMLEHRVFTYNKKTLTMSVAIVFVLGYTFYAYYVSRVLSGEITSGNSSQVFLCNNPYNPLELLMAGRAEAWVGWQAFMDKFWFGHGAWAYDTTGHYQRLMLHLHDEVAALSRDQISYHYLIPSHSVLVGSGMMNGVFALLAMGYIVFYFLWEGLRCFVGCENRYKLVLVYFVFELFWTTLFSPQSHFRTTMPMFFAIIFILYLSTRNNESFADDSFRQKIRKNQTT